jgi:hypothetical protein
VGYNFFLVGQSQRTYFKKEIWEKESNVGVVVSVSWLKGVQCWGGGVNYSSHSISLQGTVAWNGFLTLSNPSGRERKDLKIFSWWTIINGDMLSFASFYVVMCILHVRREQILFKDNFFIRILHSFWLFGEYGRKYLSVSRSRRRNQQTGTRFADTVYDFWHS